ncbi:hypothetical protein CLV35_0119 [Motilibacter peucedani]|uniref:Pyridoxal phosphate homeostasis protein n=1 Tax=Motilibacter peucedani TaxID=598650 RepID=A0A420XW16_9ACTN|nr:YggS family pyridoxal phosphate-dependent enzyme [Motilibacter peucedani]RKS84302.1 hypothetical protein CLV35_0119 [Motilibacter peucedani]
MSEDRAAELAASLAALEVRTAAACAAAGRAREEVTVVAVTKTYPASDVRVLAGLGVRDVAENREQEGDPKAAECSDLGLRWHFVGQLQRNKAASVARWAAAVHSVDRVRLVPALELGAERAGRELECFVQVQLDPSAEPGRGGAAPDEVARVADEVAASPHLRLRGLMAVAPLGADPADAFARLQELAARVRVDHPAADAVSAGMSGDLEQAVAAGATHLRIGTALLGKRAPLR